jgi:hypothetical protein
MTAIETCDLSPAAMRFLESRNVGATFVEDEAVAVGLARRSRIEEAMMEVVATVARADGDPPPAFQLTKRQIRDPIWRKSNRTVSHGKKRFIEVWQSPATREAVRRYVEERLSNKAEPSLRV